jgi:hypothetical protein
MVIAFAQIKTSVHADVPGCRPMQGKRAAVMRHVRAPIIR